MTKGVMSGRLRRAARTRALQCRLGVPRLIVHLTQKHTYAQIISTDATVLASASTLERDIRDQIRNGANIDAAKLIGQRLATKAGSVGRLGFDRSGWCYGGRIKALAEAAREGGLLF